MIENQSGAVFGPTAGIARKLDAPELAALDAPGEAAALTSIEGAIQGGGDLNGTASTSIFHGQAGTAAQRIALPRRPPNSGNYCGVI